MGKYMGVFLAVTVVNVILFFVLGALGWLDHVDGLVTAVGLIVALQNSVIISLLVYLIDLIKKRKNC